MSEPIDPGAARRSLRELLQATFRTGVITLASGKTTDFYIDGRLVTLDPRGLDLVATLALEELRGRCDAIGGPTSGADPMVAAIGLRAWQEGIPLRLFFTRREAKAHGLGRRIEGPPLRKGDRVALLDDVATSGGSLLRAATAVREETGATVERALVIVDRQEGAEEALQEAGLELTALFTREELVEGD
ncbi:MAG: orotate phosphoribosyltransferase [Planctomycetota bacterium]